MPEELFPGLPFIHSPWLEECNGICVIVPLRGKPKSGSFNHGWIRVKNRHAYQGRWPSIHLLNREGREVDFDYFVQVEKGVDYSSVKYDSLTINYRIPYSNTIQQLPLFHTTTRIFQKELNFSSGNGFCDSTEIHGTCPDGCPLDRKDGVCMNRKDTFCAPDCASGVPSYL